MSKDKAQSEFQTGYTAGIKAIDYLDEQGVPPSASVWGGLASCIITGLFATAPNPKAAEELLNFVVEMAVKHIEESNPDDLEEIQEAIRDLH